MRALKIIAVIALIGAAGGGGAGAEEALQLGRNPGECEISAALGIAKAGCAPVAQRPPVAKAVEAPPAPVPAPEPLPVAVEPPPRPFTAAFQISFEFGSARLSREAGQVLGRIASVLGSPEAARVRFRIVGHTDGVGRAADNLRLSRQRAAAVRDFLVRHAGMSASRFEVGGRGAAELLNKINPSAAENRRVEITNLGG
ncbi:MAG: OmpA family protein [Rhodospirillaceae bacterium]